MNKKIKRALAILLSLAMIFSLMPMSVLAAPSDGMGSDDSEFTGTEATGTIINFGSYPQTKVTDSATLAALDAAQKNWVSYNYCAEASYETFPSNVSPSDFMRYADIVLNGEKYRAVIFSHYRPNTIRPEQNEYSVNTVYYFKFEPLQWRVLDADAGLVMSETIIDAQPYNNVIHSELDDYYYGDTDQTYYASDWAHSDIRAWLNNDFYNTAFTAAQQAKILTTVLENGTVQPDPPEGSLNYHAVDPGYNFADTNDKVFLFSLEDVENPDYGFVPSSEGSDEYPARVLTINDYARCQGMHPYADSWLLRTAYGTACMCTASLFARDSYSGDYCRNFVSDTTKGVVPALRLAQPVPATSGTCGANATWSFDESTGTLTISGTGAMEDYASTIENTYAPWTDYLDDITSISIANGITSIGSYAFMGCMGITGGLTIPDSVTSIGERAFYYCTGLESVHVPSTVSSIGYDAFSNCAQNFHLCSDLSTLNIYKYAIQNNIDFVNCTGGVYNGGACGANVTWTLDIDTGALTISGTGAMYDYGGDSNLPNQSPWVSIEMMDIMPYIHSVNITSGVTGIGSNAFPGLSMDNLTIADTVTTIGDAAFMGCQSLTSVTIPDSVTSIGAGAFSYCTGLEYIHIPTTVSSIGYDAFSCNAQGFYICADTTDCYAKTYADANSVDFQCCGVQPVYSIDSLTVSNGPVEEGMYEVTVDCTVSAECLLRVDFYDASTNQLADTGDYYFEQSSLTGTAPYSVDASILFRPENIPSNYIVRAYLSDFYETEVYASYEYTPEPETPTGNTFISLGGLGSVSYGDQTIYSEQPVLAELGSVVNLTANETPESEFLYWVNGETNRVVSFDTTYAMRVCPASYLRAEFYEPSEGYHYVTYLNMAGNIYTSATGEYEIGETITPPTPTPLPGYIFTGWTMSAEEASNTGENVVIYPVYVSDPANTSYYVTITNDSGVTGAGYYENEQIATVSAQPAGFSYWMDENNEIVSFYPTYSFIVNYDAVLTAVYNDNTVRKEIACRTVKAIENTGAGVLTVYEEWSVARRYEVHATGFILTTDASVGTDDEAFAIGRTGVKKGTSNLNTKNGSYSLNITNWNSGKTVYVRPYIVVGDSNGQQVIYGSIHSYTAAA